jgi:carbamoyl-phosphate synthase small subunit
MKQISLVLEDGSVFKGRCQETHQTIFGEIVFNTSMTGYTEIFTDPSYAGQILLMTYPLIGNYGVYQDHYESKRVQIRGLIAKEPYFYAHRGTQLHRFLRQASIPCLYHIDTRALTLRIRQQGTMKAMLVCGALTKQRTHALIERIQHMPHPDTENLVAMVSCKRVIDHHSRKRKRIVLIDCGVKKSILKYLKSKAHVVQVPYDTPGKKIAGLEPHGIVISNGPGNPAHPRLMETTIKTLRSLLSKYPMFGICLGHQLLGIALGMETYKMRFGHRGSNHGVRNLDTNRVYITSQNHGYALRRRRAKNIHFNWINTNDGTVEGFRHNVYPIISVQFHPEAAPGPQDTRFLFSDFLDRY